MNHRKALTTTSNAYKAGQIAFGCPEGTTALQKGTASLAMTLTGRSSSLRHTQTTQHTLSIRTSFPTFSLPPTYEITKVYTFPRITYGRDLN